MGKKLASYLVLLVAGALMIYSGARTFDLLSRTLPRGQEVLAFLALLAFDGGLIAWLAVFMFGAHGGAQRAIALLMIFVSLIGIVIGFGGDTLYTASKNGMIEDVNIGMTALILTTIIIAANIAAVTFYHVLSPENQRRMAEETARSDIEEAALGAIKSQAQQLAQELAPTVASAWVQDMRAHYLSTLPPEAQRRHALSAPTVADDDDEGDYTTLTGADVQRLAQQAALWQAQHGPEAESTKPGVFDQFKAAFSGNGHKAGMGTLASDSPIVEDPEMEPPAAVDHTGKPFVSAIGKDSIKGTSWENLLGDAMRAGFEAAGLKYEKEETAQPAAKRGRGRPKA